MQGEWQRWRPAGRRLPCLVIAVSALLSWSFDYDNYSLSLSLSSHFHFRFFLMRILFYSILLTSDITTWRAPFGRPLYYLIFISQPINYFSFFIFNDRFCTSLYLIKLLFHRSSFHVLIFN